MQAEQSGTLSRIYHDDVELTCSWCGAQVPLPRGDFSGVCIDCGTVMFRPVARTAWFAPEERADQRSGGEVWIPAPAV